LRAMLLVYLVLGSDQFTEFDAHYFPEADLPFTRVSEPKNYAALHEPRGRTVLCAEIPCGRRDPIWSASDEELGALVKDGLARSGLPVRSPVLEIAVKRLPAAYPIYRIGYEENFDRVDRWVAGLPGVLSFGRQGLYAHDNTHHALYMAQAAVECLKTGKFDADAWQRYRRVFETHVVED
jgi:protoporphyrinogen oxidase